MVVHPKMSATSGDSCAHSSSHSCSCALHSSGASQTLQEMEFERGIWSAAMDGDLGRVRRLLTNGTHPSATDSSGYIALHYASRSGHEEVCDLLLNSGADVNCQTPGGVTALHRAAYTGRVGVVKCLLKHRADVTLTDSDGCTALHKAAEGGHLSVAELLLARAPTVASVRDKRGKLPRDWLKQTDSKWGKLFSNMAQV